VAAVSAREAPTLPLLILLAILAGGAGHAASADPPPTLVALADDGTLVVFRADRPGTARPVRPVGLGGRLVGIDTRPADGHLYGLTAASDLYRVDPASGRCTAVSTLTVPFDGEARSGVDFNPQVDRLRLVSAAGQNLRVNVDLGATAVDAALAYAPGDANAGKRPRITAAGYTHAVAGAPTTRLLEIDADLDVLVVQDPPNDGVLRTVGPLGVDFGPLGGLDVVTDTAGVDHAYAASGATLYAVDLESGRATVLGTIGTAPLTTVSLAATTEVAPP
jgi:hypothetical protein